MYEMKTKRKVGAGENV
uniref:Uncharacterized protein n=1 Tax=Rhizophora mucronata TaxID=61149 RepID=A0A2P2R519_RHIMU